MPQGKPPKDSPTRTPATSRKKRYIRPSSVPSSLGPIEVRFTAEGLDDNATRVDFGSFDQQERLITIRPGLPRKVEVQVLFHEWTHAVLWDTGLHNLLSDELEEALCDAIATARTAEYFN